MDDKGMWGNRVTKGRGVIFDEMAIQPGVQMNPRGKGLESFGFVDFGSYNNGINNFLKGETLKIATNVLQFLFLSYNGFRFPFAYFLTNSVTCGHLTAIFWDIINRLNAAGFFISYVCMDGAATNSSFINKMCIGTSSVATNIAYPNAKLYCIMDTFPCSEKAEKQFVCLWDWIIPHAAAANSSWNILEIFYWCLQVGQR